MEITWVSLRIVSSKTGFVFLLIGYKVHQTKNGKSEVKTNEKKTFFNLKSYFNFQKIHPTIY